MVSSTTEPRAARLFGIGAIWAGSGALAAIGYALLPVGAMLVAGRGADLLVGRVSATGNLIVLAIPVVVGWLSDRTVTRWGRRTPWLIAMTAVAVCGLQALGFAAVPVVLVLSYLVYQLGASGVGGIFTAILPDLVPTDRRGLASGVLSTMAGIGAIAGLAAVSAALLLVGENRAGVVIGYSLLALALAAATVVTTLALRERPMTVDVRADIPAGGASLAIRDFLIALHDRDFVWSAVNRALLTFGYFTVQPFLAFYFRDVGRVASPGSSAALWALVLVVAAIGPAIIGGRMSDQVGRRKPFLYASGIGQAAVVLMMIIGLPFSNALSYTLAVLFGVSYGLYYAVDLALACDVLPDRLAAGRDMGIWHAAWSVPPVLAPALAAPILHFLNQPGTAFLGTATGFNLGYRVVFASAAGWLLLGTLAVTQIRRVR